MGELEYLNEAHYSQSTMLTHNAYDCGSCGKYRKFHVIGVSFKTVNAKCIGCDVEITVPRGMFYTG